MTATQTIQFTERREIHSAYRNATCGFKNYWYPVCKASEVGDKPKALTLLDEPVMLVRRHGIAYAIADQCPHRGTQL